MACRACDRFFSGQLYSRYEQKTIGPSRLALLSHMGYYGAPAWVRIKEGDVTLGQMSLYLIFAQTFLGLAITLALKVGNYESAFVCGLVVVNLAFLSYRARQQDLSSAKG